MKRSVILQRAKDKKRKTEESEEELDHWFAHKNDVSPSPLEPLGDGGWWRKPIDMED